MNYIDFLKQNAPNNVYKENNSELIIRCPFCGDSKKNSKHVHCYVSKYPIPGYNSPMFHCMRCNTSGPVKKLLKVLGAKLTEIDIVTTNRLTTLQTTIDFYYRGTNKIDYIKQRLQVNKIPTWLEKYIIDTVVIKDKALFANFLNQYYIGFRSFDSKRINLRRIVENENYLRYITLKKDISAFDYFVVIPSSNIKLINKGIILLAEGSFSVLKGYFSLLNLHYISKYQQIILAASWSKSSFNSCVKYIYARFGVVDWDIILLADKDLDINNSNLQFSATVLYNKSGEDFGQPCDDIIEHRINNDYLRRKII